VDFDTIRRVEEYSIDCAPIVEIEWGDLFRTGYHRGITHLHHFYTHRNFLALTCVWNMVDECEEDLRDALRLLILSYNASHSTLMTRIVVKKGQKDFVITGAQSGVLYISSLPVEKNVFEGLRRKVITLCDAFHLISDSASQVQVVNASSAVLQSPDASIDYVFTDPPFGDYIPYAEINQLNEAWLGKKTDYKQEIVVSVTRGKSLSDYQSMMGQVFSEIARVVKDGAMATLVFHSAKSEVWRAMVESYSGAGFVVERTSVLDKLQSSFKQVVSEVFVKGDALLLLRKQAHSSYHATDSVDLAFHDVLERAATAKDAREREMARLYSRYVTRCLELRLHVHMSADEFYRKAKMTLEIQ
jgi:adenine-specific DNA methylase